MIDRTVGDRIHLVRAGLRLSLAEFGRRVAAAEERAVPYHEATVSQWERGVSQVQVKTIEAIAKVGNVRAAWLAFHDGQPLLAA